MTTCRVAEDLIERHLDGATTPAEELALEEHLDGCAPCSQLLALESALHARLTAEFGGRQPSPGFGHRVLDRVRREASAERTDWIAEALNVVGGLVMLVLVLRLPGLGDIRLRGTLLAVVAVLGAVGLYPLLLARLWGSERVYNRARPATTRSRR